MTPYGIDFIDKDDARGILLALLEQITHPACANPDKHFDKIRARNGKERHIRFPGHSPCQQGLARSRRSNQQHPLRNPSAELLKLLRLAQELDDLAQFLLGLIDASYVLKGQI